MFDDEDEEKISSTQKSINYYEMKRKLQKENPEKLEFEEAEVRALNKEMRGAD